MSFKDAAKHATIMGVPVVTIPLADYADLLDCKKQLATRTVNHNSFIRSRRSMIDRNPDVAVFIMQRLGLETVPAIVRACRREFGKARTPSAKSVYRYWQKLREEARLTPNKGA